MSGACNSVAVTNLMKIVKYPMFYIAVDIKITLISSLCGRTATSGTNVSRLEA